MLKFDISFCNFDIDISFTNLTLKEFLDNTLKFLDFCKDNLVKFFLIRQYYHELQKKLQPCQMDKYCATIGKLNVFYGLPVANIVESTIHLIAKDLQKVLQNVNYGRMYITLSTHLPSREDFITYSNFIIESDYLFLYKHLDGEVTIKYEALPSHPKVRHTVVKILESYYEFEDLVINKFHEWDSKGIPSE